MDTTFDYAGPRVRTPRAFWPLSRRRKISIGALLSALVVSITLFNVHQYHVRAASLTSLGGNQAEYPDGREVRIWTAGNANRRTAVVLILHYSTPDPKRLEMVPGRVYSSDVQLQGMRSTFRLTTFYPPDPQTSGVWIDGQRRPMSDRMVVIYISDKRPATDIAIGEADQASFVGDVRKLDPLHFLDKWIKPRLPSAGE